MDSHWVIWVDVKFPHKARKLLDRVAARMERQPTNVEVERYPKTGEYRIAFRTELESSTWNDQIVETIFLGQCIASDWHLLGFVLDDASAVAS